MSGGRWLLDTNVVIGLLKKQSAAVALVEAHQLELRETSVSQVTRMALLGFPGLTGDEEAEILKFLGFCRVLLLDEGIERRAIQLRRSSRCKLPDAIIAATALVHGLKLLTLDQQLMALMEKCEHAVATK